MNNEPLTRRVQVRRGPFLTGLIFVRKFLHLALFVVLLTAGLNLTSAPAQAADTGNAAPQTGKIVSDEPSKMAPNILDGTVYSVAKVGNTIIVGGQFTQAQNYNTSTTVTRIGVLAFDATTGKISTTFAPDPLGTVYKVLPAADGNSVYVAGSFNSAGGQSTPSRLIKVNVNTGVIDPTFTPPTISGDIRDLELVGNHLFVAGKFTHLSSTPQKALGSVFADTGKRDPFVNNVFAGLHNTKAGAVTAVLQISVNKQNNRLMAVGNFTTVDGVDRHQIVQLDITGAAPVVTNWDTNLFRAACSSNFETYMSDVEYSPNGLYFVVSTTGAYGGVTGSMNGTIGCDVVARFEGSGTGLQAATWTAYTGGDTTWTVEVTDNVVYAGGHQRWQNNPGAGDTPGPGAVSREGIAALNPVTGQAYSWNPTRARGVGVQDMLATSEGLYVGSDTELIGHTAGNTYHARIALLPLAGGTNLPQLQTTALPVDVFRVNTAASQLVKRNFNGTTATTAVNAPTGPGWGTSTGAFMVNGVLYKTNTDGSLSKMTFNGTTYGTATPVNTADALVFQTDWHNDAKTLTSLFYSGGFIYYTKSGVNALYRRSFEVESGIIGQQRFSTTITSINWQNVRGGFVANGKLYYANTLGQLLSTTWNQAAHTPVVSTAAVLSGAGTGWASRAMFSYQAVPAPLNEAPLAAATVSCDQLVCSFDGTASSDPEAGPLTYDWDFGDGTAHGTGATTTHTYASAGDRAVTLTVTDNKGATASIARTASPTNIADNITFVGKTSTSGSRTNHQVPVPAGTQPGDTMLLFFASNSTGPVYTGPAGWQQVLSENGSSFTGRLYSKTATASDVPGSQVTVTSRTAATPPATYYVKSDTTLASYRGVGSPALTATAITTQSVANPVHQTPTVTSPDGTNWLVSYWTDKSSATTDWTGPASQTERSVGTASGSSHMSSLLMDSNGRVNSGGQGGLNATANSSAQGLTMSVLLSGGEPAPVNQDPTANASVGTCTNLTCSFDGASSFDPEGGNLTYDWDWGDGTTHGTTAAPSHTFTSPGVKTVTLTVTDPQGGTGSDPVTTPNLTAAPVNQAPTAHITNRSCTNLVCSFDGSTSSDPDPQTLSYSWNFGDGSPLETTANPSHTFATAGSKTVTLTVSDGTLSDDDSTTFTVTAAPPPNTAPTAHITNPSCTDLACSFTGSTSSDPDAGDTMTYNWDFGDGSTDATTQNASRTYTTAGAKTVTLTVTDAAGLSDTDSVIVNPTEPDGDPVSNVAFVGSAGSVSNGTMAPTVTLPSGVQVGDTMLLFLGAASSPRTYTTPAGWTLLESEDGASAMSARAWTKKAVQADTVANAKVSLTASATTKTEMTVAIYRGTDGTNPIVVSASTIDNAAGAAHTSPAVTATDDTSWLVTYWADRSDTTTAWTAPAAATVRRTAAGTGSSHVAALLGDSNGPVAPGAQGQLTATANGASSRGASFSILLKSS